MPNISVIIPCYNSGKFIASVLQSVIDQTYKDWEIILVDDCSTDNTTSIIREFMSKDNRIKLLKTECPSGSPSVPRNIGINNSIGEYIAFLDSDDIWLPNKLEKQIEFMINNSYDISYSYYEKMTWNGERNNRLIRTRKKTTYNNLLKTNSIPCLTSMVTKRAIGETRFREIPQEDFCFWLDILKKGYIAHNLGLVTAIYRESDSSRSANKFAMFKGYWNVIHNIQKIPFIKCCLLMLSYSFHGIIKFLK